MKIRKIGERAPRRTKHAACPPTKCVCHTPTVGGRLPRTLDDVVDAFIREYRDRQDGFAEFYRDQPDLRSALDVSVLCLKENGKRHDHQYRIPGAVLKKARARVRESDVKRCSTFADLFDYLDGTIGSMRGIGELTVYDVATRIGAFRRLEPDAVYLHAGTRKGAKALGLGRGKAKLEIGELPAAFARLRPAEVEDCLCIFKEDLASAFSGFHDK